MSWLIGLLPGLFQWLFSGSVQTTVAHSPDDMARLGLDQKSLTGIAPLIIFALLCCCAGCDVVHVDLGTNKSDVTLALCEPANIATITTDDSIPVIVTTKSGATLSQLQANYNCKDMVVMPKSSYRALKAKAFPDLPVVTLAAVEIPLGGAAVTVQTVIVEVGEPIEIATDTALDVEFFDKTIGKQNCAGLYALKRSVYDRLQAQANPTKEVKP